MNRKTYLLLFSAILIVLNYACKPKEVKKEIVAGEVDAKRYVSIGGSITAGFMDDALYEEGQQNSFSAILSEQFELIGGAQMNQALMLVNSVGNNESGLSRLILGYKLDCLNVSSLSPVREAAIGDVANFLVNNYNSSSPFTNFGIPNLRSTQYAEIALGNPANGAGNYNPYFARMASDQANASVKSDIINANPTFFTLFTGIDEVLEYAKKGASIGSLTPAYGAIGVGFDGSVDDLLSALTSNGSRGAIATIPDVTAFPYFTTIPYNGLELDADKAQTLNDIYNPIGIYFYVGKNAFMIEDPDAGAFGMRQLLPGEKILLNTPLDSVKCYKMGSVFPFRNEFILTNTEILEIQNSIQAYNLIIGTMSSEYNLALVDTYSFYQDLNSGLVYNGISMSAKFVSGGAYSLDGINLNPRGNALLANQFIKSINQKYKSTLPTIDATKYRGVIFP